MFIQWTAILAIDYHVYEWCGRKWLAIWHRRHHTSWGKQDEWATLGDETIDELSHLVFS